MAKFLVREPVIEATQWFPGVDIPGVIYGDAGICFIRTRNGHHQPLSPGYWVISDEDGTHQQLLDSASFETLYRPAEQKELDIKTLDPATKLSHNMMAEFAAFELGSH